MSVAMMRELSRHAQARPSTPLPTRPRTRRCSGT